MDRIDWECGKGVTPVRNAASTAQRPSKAWWLAVATLIAVFMVNTLGFADTVTGSALGCGHNWPLCNGQLVPTHWTQAVIIEYVHRVSVLIAMVLFTLLSVTVFRKYRLRRDILICFALMLAGILIEAVLGAITVLIGNPPYLMAMHMGVALLSFVGVVLLTVVVRQLDGRAPNVRFGRAPEMLRTFRRVSGFGVVYSYVAIYIGAYAASTGEGPRFQGWPLPTESITTPTSPFWLDVLHRSVALGFLILALVIWVVARRMRSQRPDLLRVARLMPVLVLLQGVSGGMMIASHISVWAFLLHVTIASLLLAGMCYLVFVSREDTLARPLASVGGVKPIRRTS
jgi:cytochrome c oxidase assembly protein subunit 15